MIRRVVTGVLVLGFATCGGPEPVRCRTGGDPELDEQVRSAWDAIVDLLGERPRPAVLVMTRSFGPRARGGRLFFGWLGAIGLDDVSAMPNAAAHLQRWEVVFHEVTHVWSGSASWICWEEGLATAVSWELGRRGGFPRSRLTGWYTRLAEGLHEVLVAHEAWRYVKPALHREGCEDFSLRACFDVDRFVAEFPEPARAGVRARLADARLQALSSAEHDGRPLGWCPAPR